MKTKQLLLFFLLFLVCSIDIQAQHLTYGIKGGLTAGVLIGPFNPETDKGKPVTNPHIGLYMKWNLNEKFAVQTELLYTQTGVQYETYVPNSDTIWPIEFERQGQTVVNNIETFLAGNIKGEYKLAYVELPVRFIWQVSERLGLSLGPRIAYLLNGENMGDAVLDIGRFAGQQDQFDSQDAYVNSLFLHQIQQEFDESHTINPFDLGLSGGGHWQLNNRLLLGVNANYGFLAVQEKSNVVQDNFTNLYVTTSVAFKLGKGM